MGSDDGPYLVRERVLEEDDEEEKSSLCVCPDHRSQCPRTQPNGVYVCFDYLVSILHCTVKVFRPGLDLRVMLLPLLTMPGMWNFFCLSSRRSELFVCCFVCVVLSLKGL